MSARAWIDQRRPHGRAPGEGAHCALFYADDGECLAGVTRFLAPAAAAAEPVVLAVPENRARLLCERLDGLGVPYETLDVARLGRNPARMIPAVERLLAAHQGRTLHYIAEPIWPGRSPDEVEEAARQEALINLAWPAASIRVLCLYDAARLEPQVLAQAKRTHPALVHGTRQLPSPAYAGPSAPAGAELKPAPEDAQSLEFGLGDLAALRAVVTERARARGLGEERTGDLALAVNELATNTIRHAGGRGALRVWDRPDRLVCEVQDDGHIADPMAGERIPRLETGGGAGLWLVNQVCDLVEARSSRRGTIVRLHMALA